jgi:putative transposase
MFMQIPIIMPGHRRKFSEEEKLNVLQEAGRVGVNNILRQYNISYSAFARWKKGFLEKGIDPVARKTTEILLIEENARLKKIIADMALSLELKDEELKRANLFNARNADEYHRH